MNNIVKKSILYTVLLFLVAQYIFPLLSYARIVSSGDFRLSAEVKWDSNLDQNYVDLNWDNVNGAEGYQLYQSDEENSFEGISSSYGKAIQVLNIYPDLAESNTLKGWLDGLGLKDDEGNNLINVTDVSLKDFNVNPIKYLEDNDGKYKYSSLFFGSWDDNNSKDISEVAAQEVEKYINTGRGVLFGHDTVTMNNPIFLKFFKDYVGVDNTTDSLKRTGSDSVQVIDNGSLLKYPFEIPNDAMLSIPYAHNVTLSNKNIGTTWVEFINPNGKWPNPIYDDGTWRGGWYLKTNKNTGMIQTGHSMGESSLDERKMIANALYYVQLFSSDNKGTSRMVKDTTLPSVPDAKIQTQRGTASNFSIDVVSEDFGNEYQWYVEAGTKKSDVIKEEIKSNIAGYIYVTDDSADTDLKNIVDTTYKDNFGKIPKNKFNEYVAPEEGSTSNDYETEATFTNLDSSKDYIHIVSVDRVNNVSETKTIQLNGTTKVRHINQEDVSISSEILMKGNLYFDQFTANKKNIVNYNFEEVDLSEASENVLVDETTSSVKGPYTSVPQTITYRYKGKEMEEQGKVTIEYRNQEGSLLDSTSFTGIYGQNYNISTDQDGSLLKEFSHYTRDPLPQNAVGTITDFTQTITLTYKGEMTGKNVKVNYVNQEGVSLNPTIDALGTGQFGSPYTTDEKTFENYDFEEVDPDGAPATGVYTDSPQTVTYKYKGQKVGDNRGRVTVQYVNQEGVELTPSIEAIGDGYYGSSYTTDEKTFENYDFEEVDPDGAPATGVYTDSPQTVTYKYKGQDIGDAGRITIEYRNQVGKKLDSTSFTGSYGQVYNISTDQDGSLIKEFDHYTIDPLPQNAVGTITDSPQTVVVTYTGEQVAETIGKVTVQYVNQEGVELTPSIEAVGDGYYGSSYTTDEKTFENYDFEEVDPDGAPATGVYTDSPQTVTYKYKGSKSGTVTVYYKNQAGDDLLNEPVVLAGEFGSNYQTERKEFAHYSSDDYPTNESGTFSTTNQVVTYTYTGEDLTGIGDVTVRYETVAGFPIFDTPPVITGRYGDHFITELKTSLSYDFVRVTNNGEETSAPVNGVLSDNPQVILYSYQGKDAGKVSVSYVNQIGQVLKKEEFKGKIGDQTLIQPPVVPHYILDPNQELNINFTNEAQAITVTYTGEVAQAITEKHVGSDGHVFKEEVHEGHYGDAYEYDKLATSDTVGYVYEKVTGAPNKGNFTDKAQTITFMYKKNPVKKGKINVTYVDNSSEHKQLALPTTTTGTIGTLFEAKAKTIKGYTPDTVTKDVLYTEDTQTVTFIYTKDTVAGKNVTVKFLDENGKTISGVNSVELIGDVGVAYDTTSDPDVEGSLIAAEALGYRPEEVPKNAVGTFTTKNQTVLYVLKQGEIAGGNVTISYREEGTTAPIVGVDDLVLTGTIGQKYYTEAVKIKGYEVVGTSTKQGNFTSSAQTLVFTYKKAIGATVTIRFVNEEGAEIKTSEQRMGLIGNQVWSEAPPEITGYSITQVSATELSQLLYSSSEQILTLNYEFIETLLTTQAKIICVDLYGNILKTSAQMVQSGSEYLVSAPDIPNYNVLGNGLSIKVKWRTGEPAPIIYFTYNNR